LCPFPTVCVVTGTFYGPAVQEEYSVTGFQHTTDADLFIFVTYEIAHYKMTAVSLAEAKVSASPSTPVDKYITTSNTIVLSAAVVNDMWDGTLTGYATNVGGVGDGYEMKDVNVDGCTGIPPANCCPHRTALIRATQGNTIGMAYYWLCHT
jgi:hypothetical protein